MDKNKKFTDKEYMDTLDREIKEENQILKDWIIRNYGKKCKEKCHGCVVCEAWQKYEDLRLLEVTEKNIQKLLKEPEIFKTGKVKNTKGL